MKIFVTLSVLLVVLASEAVLGKPTSAPPSGHVEMALEQFGKNTQKMMADLTKTLTKDLPDSKQMVEMWNQNLKKLAGNVESVVDKINFEIKHHKTDIDNVNKNVQEQLNKAATSLKSMVGPEASTKANEIKEKLKSIGDSIDKLVKSLEPETAKAKTELKNAATTLLDEIVEVTKKLKTQIGSQ